MTSLVSWCNDAITFVISDQYVDLFKKFIFTVDPTRATKSLFDGVVSVEWGPEYSYAILNKIDGKFSYEEIDDLLDKVVRIVQDFDHASCSKVLMVCSTNLKSTHRLFVPQPEHTHCFAVDSDRLIITTLSDNALSPSKCFAILKKDFAELGCIISMEHEKVIITGYVGKINIFIELLINFLIFNKICNDSDKKQFIESIVQLMVHDVVLKELPLLHKLAHCSEPAAVVPYRGLAHRMIEIFSKINSGNIQILNQQDKNLLNSGYAKTEQFKDCPPILARCFERLFARLPSSML